MKGVFFWRRLQDLQAYSIDRSLSEAALCFRIAAVVSSIHGEGHDGALLTRSWKLQGFAHLNRACELASLPLAQYYCETSAGIDLIWSTYRPEAIANSPATDPAAMVYLGTVDNLTEDQARARAIGY